MIWGLFCCRLVWGFVSHWFNFVGGTARRERWRQKHTAMKYKQHIFLYLFRFIEGFFFFRLRLFSGFRVAVLMVVVVMVVVGGRKKRK